MKSYIYLAVIVLATLFSCNSEKKSEHGEEHEEHGTEGVVVLNKQQREALKLQLGTFQMRNLTTVVKVNGQLEVPPASSAEVAAVIGGNVKEIKVFHGDKVQKGQILAVLEHPDYITIQENFAEVANNLDFLQEEYNRQKELFENNVGAGRDFQKVKSEYNTTKARYEGLKSRLLLLNLSPQKVKDGIVSNTISVVSPIQGFVNDVDIKVGKYVDASDVLFSITDNNDIHADFQVYEKDVHLVRLGQKVHFTASSVPNKELTAKVFAIGKEFEKNTRAVHIHAKLDEKNENLIPGMYISGHLHTDNNYTRTLPNDAIVTEGTKSYIFILTNEVPEEHEGHDHDSHNEMEESHEGNDHAEHGDDDHDDHDNDKQAFKMVEVITGQKDDGFTEVRLMDSLPDDTQVVTNVAYYLLSDLKKEETEHEH
nr:efflux RND transporter periplasmic adaptor subunit [uncultured Carboxylicivirga sp.]